jgi:putative membrane protein
MGQRNRAFVVMFFIPGIRVDRIETALVAALVLGLVNALLRPVLVYLTLPLTIMSLGFFTLIINGALFYMVSKLVKGFSVVSFWDAVWGALLFSVFSFMLNIFFKPGRMSAPGFSGQARRSMKRGRGAGGRLSILKVKSRGIRFRRKRRLE